MQYLITVNDAGVVAINRVLRDATIVVIPDGYDDLVSTAPADVLPVKELQSNARLPQDFIRLVMAPRK